MIVTREKRNFILWIPSLITLLVCGTAFFTDVAFGYDGNYEFYRGPLGYVPFIVPTFYLLLILWITFRRLTERSGKEKYITPICGAFCLASSLVDAINGGVRLNEAIMISSVFFCMFLYSHDNRRDSLTGLLNRQAFYDDCASFGKSIGAVASMDMNGLKTLNDSLGHHAGDEALVNIGECMDAVTNRRTSAYRIGGDEFVILFFHGNEEAIVKAKDQIVDSVARRGYSVSAGYAMRGKNEDLEETIRESDSRMYEDKANYYRINTRDRRRN